MSAIRQSDNADVIGSGRHSSPCITGAGLVSDWRGRWEQALDSHSPGLNRSSTRAGGFGFQETEPWLAAINKAVAPCHPDWPNSDTEPNGPGTSLFRCQQPERSARATA
jgi:hypothetical protein